MKEAEKEGDEPIDITPKKFSVRTVTQEYGGGAFGIFEDTVICSNYKDQRLYKQSISSKGFCFSLFSLPGICNVSASVELENFCNSVGTFCDLVFHQDSWDWLACFL